MLSCSGLPQQAGPGHRLEWVLGGSGSGLQHGSGLWGGAQGSSLACTHCEVLELNPRVLGPSRLVRKPDARVHSGSMYSLQMSGNLPRGIQSFFS